MFFGAQYYRPPFPDREDWERDFANMKQLGFNTVKLWVVWNWVERIPKEFDFSELDCLVKLAADYGLGVVLNTIPEGAPHWTMPEHESALYQTAKGEKIRYGGPANIPSAGWPGLCMDSPEAETLVCRFIEATAAHFAANPAIVAIDVWNEPHLEPMLDYRAELMCYCPHSLRQFASWLREKYSDLDALNRAWHRSYTHWAQVEPPPRFGTWADMMDWRLFWLQNLARWMRLRVAAAKRGAPQIPAQSHVAYSAMVGNALTGGLGNELGDEFLLAREVDLFGLTSFPKWLMGKDQQFIHMLHHEIIASASRGKPYYQVELQGGGGKAGLLGGEVPDERDVTLWNYNAVAAGAKGVLYWQYAPEPAGIESPGFGLTGFLGENTPRSLAASRCSQELNTPTIDRARPAHITNAIYLSRQSELLCFSAERREELYAGSVAGVAKAAYLHCVPVRFVHADYLASAWEEGVRTLYLPMALALSAQEIDQLERFVRTGGTLIAECCPGLYDETGLLMQQSQALKQIWGLGHVEVQGMGDSGTIRAGCFGGSLYRQLVTPGKDVRVTDTFADTTPAMTERSLGKGRAIWLGSFAGLFAHKTGDAITLEFLAGLFDLGGYDVIREIRSRHSKNDPMLAPVIRLLETPDAWLLVTSNHRFEDTVVEIEFRSPQKITHPNYCNGILSLVLNASKGSLVEWRKE